jgi:hypothetical protein
MKVKYPGPIDEVILDEIGVSVRAGESVEVPNEIGDQLIEQGWEGRHSSGWKSEHKADVAQPADVDETAVVAENTEG